MNRIILIGNGFDLAHKMQTGYRDFIENYWKTIVKELHQKSGQKQFNNSEISIENIPRTWVKGYSYETLKTNLKRNKTKITFKNKFLEVISDKTFLNNWVDIECEYYDLLKEIINNPSFRRYEDISKLNSDFEKIKKHLEEYLNEIEKTFEKDFRNPSLKSRIGRNIYSCFNLRDFTEGIAKEIVKIELKNLEIRKNNLIKGKEQETMGDNIILGNSIYPEREVREALLDENACENFDLIPNQIIFLNFNYTTTAYIYNDQRKYLTFPTGFKKEVTTEFINIHGELYNTNNPIIFGFGDEIDNDYKKIEDLNDNRYLHYIKSIKYLETENYKNFLRILDDDFFQVFIFGHSCGLSDRTLLNTLFEHSNCGSIKTFFYKIDEETDNFSDIARNISRNFNSKSKMREKVVNKTYCKPLIE